MSVDTVEPDTRTDTDTPTDIDIDITPTGWQVPSQTHGWKVMYDVTYDPATKKWSCKCAGWRRHLKDCKHIKWVQKEQNDLEAARLLISLFQGGRIDLGSIARR